MTAITYIAYIKDEDARQFAAYAHKLEQYNVQIHKWYAEQIPDVSINKLSTFIGNHVRHRILPDHHHFE